MSSQFHSGSATNCCRRLHGVVPGVRGVPTSDCCGTTRDGRAIFCSLPSTPCRFGPYQPQTRCPKGTGMGIVCFCPSLSHTPTNATRQTRLITSLTRRMRQLIPLQPPTIQVTGTSSVPHAISAPAADGCRRVARELASRAGAGTYAGVFRRRWLIGRRAQTPAFFLVANQ